MYTRWYERCTLCYTGGMRGAPYATPVVWEGITLVHPVVWEGITLVHPVGRRVHPLYTRQVGGYTLYIPR